MKLLTKPFLAGIFLLSAHLAPKGLLASEIIHAAATVSALTYEFPPDTSAKIKERDLYVVRYKLVIVNKGSRPVRIPTADFIKAGEAGPNYTKTELVWDLSSDDDGITTVVSEAELKPVLLRPNEAVVLRWSESEFNLLRLDKVQLKLRITEAFGKRYDLWSGEITVTDIQIYREKEKQPAQK